MIEQKKSAAAVKAEEIIAKAEREAETLLEESRMAAQNECAQLKARAAERMDQAAELIVGRIVEEL